MPLPRPAAACWALDGRGGEASDDGASSAGARCAAVYFFSSPCHAAAPYIARADFHHALHDAARSNANSYCKLALLQNDMLQQALRCKLQERPYPTVLQRQACAHLEPGKHGKCVLLTAAFSAAQRLLPSCCRRSSSLRCRSSAFRCVGPSRCCCMPLSLAKDTCVPVKHQRFQALWAVHLFARPVATTRFDVTFLQLWLPCSAENNTKVTAIEPGIAV